MARIIDEGTEIICMFEPLYYITDRRNCLFYVLEKYRDRIPDEVIDKIYEMNLWEVDGLENALSLLERYIGKTIITRPIDPDDQ
jgi:hypothetical protein